MGRTDPTITNLDVLVRNDFEPTLLPTPEASDGSGGRVSAVRGGTRPSGAKRAVTLATAISHDLLPTPTARDDKGRNQRDDDTCLAGALLPTPRTSDANGPGHHGTGGMDLRTAILLPTPTAMDSHQSGGSTDSNVTLTDATVRHPDRFGRYAAAVRRWERIFGREAPQPTHGKQVNARFVEWMMGVPDGWVTDVLPNRKALRVLGNGVVPAQARAAITALWNEVTA